MRAGARGARAVRVGRRVTLRGHAQALVLRVPNTLLMETYSTVLRLLRPVVTALRKEEKDLDEVAAMACSDDAGGNGEWHLYRGPCGRRYGRHGPDWSLLDTMTWPEFYVDLVAVHERVQSRREADLRAGYAHLNGGAAASFEDLVGADSQSETTWALIPRAMREAAQRAAVALERGTEAHALDVSLHVAALEFLCEALLDIDCVRYELESRAEHGGGWSDAGEDGNAESCGLCCVGGALVCCDHCPAAFHLRCIAETNRSLPDNWACPECATSDPSNFGARHTRVATSAGDGLLIAQGFVTRQQLSACGEDDAARGGPASDEGRDAAIDGCGEDCTTEPGFELLKPKEVALELLAQGPVAARRAPLDQIPASADLFAGEKDADASIEPPSGESATAPAPAPARVSVDQLSGQNANPALYVNKYRNANPYPDVDLGGLYAACSYRRWPSMGFQRLRLPHVSVLEAADDGGIALLGAAEREVSAMIGTAGSESAALAYLEPEAMLLSHIERSLTGLLAAW